MMSRIREESAGERAARGGEEGGGSGRGGETSCAGFPAAREPPGGPAAKLGQPTLA